jgi:cytoskeletal protein CcmA (bactofilin family)
MFAPRSTQAGRSEGQNPRFKDVVFCEGSWSPLAVPGAWIATIWDQVYEGLRLVPRGGAEVGGLFLGRRSQTDVILAEAVVPIPIAYHFGPSFRLSPSDLKDLEALIASLQQDPSKAVVGLYRSRTRNESLSQDSDSAALATIEHAHASFASDFHYYVAFTPTSRSTMMASASFRKEEGWDDWQHVTLVINPKSSALPTEPVRLPAAPQPSSSLSEQPSATTAATVAALPLAEPHPRPVADGFPEPVPPSQSNGKAREIPKPSEHIAPPAAPQASIGKAVKISGPIYSKEDLYIDGDVEGSIELQEHRLTIGPNGRVRSNVKAREVVILGTLQGNVDASDKLEVRKDARLIGEIKTARIVIEDGAYFKGSIDIVRPQPANSSAGCRQSLAQDLDN